MHGTTSPFPRTSDRQMAMTCNLAILQILLFLFRRKYQHVLEICLEGGPIFKEIYMFPRSYAHPYLTTHTNAQKGGRNIAALRYIQTRDFLSQGIQGDKYLPYVGKFLYSTQCYKLATSRYNSTCTDTNTLWEL